MDERDSPTKDRVRSVIAGNKDLILALPPTKKLQRITFPLSQHTFILSIQFHCHKVSSYCQYKSTVTTCCQYSYTATTYPNPVNKLPLPQYIFMLSIQFHCHNIYSSCQYNSTATTYIHTVNTILLPQHIFVLSILFYCHNISSYCQYDSTATILPLYDRVFLHCL